MIEPPPTTAPYHGLLRPRKSPVDGDDGRKRFTHTYPFDGRLRADPSSRVLVGGSERRTSGTRPEIIRTPQPYGPPSGYCHCEALVRCVRRVRLRHLSDFRDRPPIGVGWWRGEGLTCSWNRWSEAPILRRQYGRVTFGSRVPRPRRWFPESDFYNNNPPYNRPAKPIRYENSTRIFFPYENFPPIVGSKRQKNKNTMRQTNKIHPVGTAAANARRRYLTSTTYSQVVYT